MLSGKSCCNLAKWLYSGKSDCIRGKVFGFAQKWLDSGQNFLYGQTWFYSGKSRCVRAKVVVFGQKLLFSGKNGCIREKVLVLGQSG